MEREKMKTALLRHHVRILELKMKTLLLRYHVCILELIFCSGFMFLVGAAITLGPPLLAPHSPFVRNILEFLSLHPIPRPLLLLLLSCALYGSAEMAVQCLRSNGGTTIGTVPTSLVLWGSFWVEICVLALLLVARMVDLTRGVIILSAVSTTAVTGFKLVAASQHFLSMAWLVVAQSTVAAVVLVAQGCWFEAVLSITPIVPAICAFRTPGDKLYSHITHKRLSVLEDEMLLRGIGSLYPR